MVGTAPSELATETNILDGLLRALAQSRGGTTGASNGLFLASSAGGVYAGGVGGPYDERSAVTGVSAYGRNKLLQEDLVRRWAGTTGHNALIGRITNLFGPGQNISKPQGLITQLCWNDIRSRPSSIYVSLDTIRDYLYVADCAVMIDHGIRLTCRTPFPEPIIKIFASHNPLTIGAVIGQCRRVFHRNVRVSTRQSSSTSIQVRDLRMRSVVLPEIDGRASTTFPAGLHQTYEDLRRRHAALGATR